MDRLYVQTAYAGDIISILPLVKLDADSGKTVGLLTHKRFAPILDGVSYCKPVTFEGEELDIAKAVEQAKNLCSDIKVTQVIGPPDAVKKYAYEPSGVDHAIRESFVREAWRLAGRDDAWKDQPPLVFDRRDSEREAQLLKLLPTRRKSILISLGGNTSPFPYEHRELLVELVRMRFNRHYNVIDISDVKAHRIYDFLALYEQAHCLISSDSAPLHLAYAVNSLPVVALAKDSPTLWHGSPWRPSHICHIRYSDFPSRAIDMLRSIEGIRKPGSWFLPRAPRSIIHVWSQYEINERNRLAHEKASESWSVEYEGPWISNRLDIGSIRVDSKLSPLQDDKRYPYLKDLLRIACLRAREDDVICFTRCDTGFEVGLGARLLEATLPVYAHRVIRNGNGDTWHPGVDLFAFTKSWWNANKKDCPDLIVGMDPYWNLAFVEFLRMRGGSELPDAIYRGIVPPPQKTDTKPKREAHNESLYRKFIEKNKPPLLVRKVSQQIECLPISRRALFPYGYNPSIIRHNGALLMAYRWHDKGTPATSLAMAEIDNASNVTANGRIEIAEQGDYSAEDPRLFMFKGELHMAYVMSTWPKFPPNCVVMFAKLKKEGNVWKTEPSFTPNIGHNDWSALEKNWVPFEYEGSIHVIYSGGTCYRLDPPGMFPTKMPTWKWGQIRGGTTPLPYNGEWLRFFHSGLDFEIAPYRRRYYVGAMLMSSKPPFELIAVSSKPVLIGSEEDDMADIERSGCQQFKPKCCLPYGAVECEGGWLLSVGINDAECLVAKITPEKLNL